MKRVLLAICLTGVSMASLATGAVAAGKGAAVTCRGSERKCTATVSLAGGASNKVVKIALPGTSWRRPTIRVTPTSSRGAYSISHAAFALGGSEYRFTLNAVKANRSGSHLTLTFNKR